MTKNLKNRFEKLKEIMEPKNNFFIVMVNTDDASVEAAKERVLKSAGLNEIPEDAFCIILNMFAKPEK